MSRQEQIAAAGSVREQGKSFSVDSIEQALDDFYSLRTYNQQTAFDIFDNIDNAANPHDMVRYLHHLFRDNGLSARWSKKLWKVMAKGDDRGDRKSVKTRLKYWGGKGGSDMGMGNVAGYGITAKGNHIFYAIMGSHMVDDDGDWDIIKNLITWVFDTLDDSA